MCGNWVFLGNYQVLSLFIAQRLTGIKQYAFRDGSMCYSLGVSAQ